MAYQYHPTINTTPTTPSFPSFPWELFSPYYTNPCITTPYLYFNHGYTPPPPNSYSSYSSSHYSYTYNNYHQQLQPTTTYSTISPKYQNHSSIKKDFEKYLQASHLNFKIRKTQKKSYPNFPLSHSRFKPTQNFSFQLLSHSTTAANNNNNNVNPNSPLTNRSNRLSTGISTGRRLSAGGNYSDATEETEYVSYTVHIPPTPDRMPLSSSQTSLPEENARNNPNYNPGTIFTAGFNSVTRGHVIECSKNCDSQPMKSKLICGMKGCDEDALKDCTCECGFKICKDCYKECCANGNGIRGGGNKCPGCKEPYNNVSDSEEEEEEEEEASECEDQALPLPSMGEFKLDKRLSLVKSFKAQNHPQDFDHTRWLFETKGTYGDGNAVWPKDGYGSNGYEPPPDFGKKSRRPLTRKVGFSAAILSPYRLLILMRRAALGLFLTWRIRHRNHEAMWLWGMSVTCELWFAFSWLLDQVPKLCPVNRVTDLAVLKEWFESANLRNPKERSDLLGIDVFVSTADPEKEPPLVTANTILSILAVDYPVEKVACYLSDDGGALLTFEALAETASFARVWVPFCKKHQIEPRNPEAYFGQKRDFLKNKVRLDFVRERRRVKREYDEFKVRVNSLPESIRRRSDAYNAHEELRAKKKQMETGSDISDLIKVPRATWMSGGSHWPGTWPSAEPDHSRGDHAGIIQAMLAPPNVEPEYGTEADGDNLIDSTDVDVRLPMLVYGSREKRPGYDHNKKAGAMNALVQTRAIMSNGPFILNLDRDHYIYNSLAIREGMCFMLDRGGDRICYVQFPQRFEGIDPSDRYAIHNTVFFDVSMRALDGLQGPMYVGTGCIFRRTALYGFSPPRASEHHGWYGRNGEYESALEVFYEMLDEMVQPNSVTFVSVLSACSHSGQVERGTNVNRYFNCFTQWDPGKVCIMTLLLQP